MEMYVTSSLGHPMAPFFFSNLPHKMNGPAGELRIGVNLGIDWYV